jgi:hypothetical protein
LGASLLDINEVSIIAGTLTSTGTGTYRASFDAASAAWPMHKRRARLMATTTGGGKIALTETIIDVQ